MRLSASLGGVVVGARFFQMSAASAPDAITTPTTMPAMAPPLRLLSSSSSSTGAGVCSSSSSSGELSTSIESPLTSAFSSPSTDCTSSVSAAVSRSCARVATSVASLSLAANTLADTSTADCRRREPVVAEVIVTWSAETPNHAAMRLWSDASMASVTDVTLRLNETVTLAPSVTVNVVERRELAVPSAAHDTAITVVLAVKTTVALEPASASAVHSGSTAPSDAVST
mmetsp:Transcript_15646/g.36923  ORF Transcript_15646/g.36923 Transcript_15646/m.36923 type:complete len:228 (-) Transcript_15646:12162-12845(-)